MPELQENSQRSQSSQFRTARPTFTDDVFISYSADDRPAILELADRLKADGLRVWLDVWELRPGDNLLAKVEEGLERSRVLVLCMSRSAFASDWSALESTTFRFRDPLNRERRFIPLRLDTAPIRESLAQFIYVDWTDRSDHEYQRLLLACQPPPVSVSKAAVATPEISAEHVVRLQYGVARAAAFNPRRTRVLLAGGAADIGIWDCRAGHRIRTLKGNAGSALTLCWSNESRHALSGSDDGTLRLWDATAGRCVGVLEEGTSSVYCAAFGSDGTTAVSGGADRRVRLWDLTSGRCERRLEGHAGAVLSVGWTSDGRHIVSGSTDSTLGVWDVQTGYRIRALEGHTGPVVSIGIAPRGSRCASGSGDGTVRVWDTSNGQCIQVLEGHSDQVDCLSWDATGRFLISGSRDATLRIWDIDAGSCVRLLLGHTAPIISVNWDEPKHAVSSCDASKYVRTWTLPPLRTTASRRMPRIKTDPHRIPNQVQYTNAKVLLVGETGAGKTGLSMRLAFDDWKPTDSTVGAWASQLKLADSNAEGVEREIWLWDFGGQADQRLIHQLYVDDTALAVFVFDGQKEDVFDTLAQWDRDLARASRRRFKKLLVAGRVDAGGLRVSKQELRTFAKERGFADRLFETSAKTGADCTELKAAIVRNIAWEEIPWRSSPLLFKRLKEEIVKLKDVGRVLMRFNELRETLRLRLAGENVLFTDDDLKAVIGLLAGPGVVWELEFGSWILLQPERINAYAQAAIQTMRSDEQERGCVREEQLLTGDLGYHSSMTRLDPEEERFVLLAMHQKLVERGLCLREETEQGALLIFPSYYRRERPDLVGHRDVLVSYRFTGFLDDIYATLVVRLHHTHAYIQDQLWRYAAEFRTPSGQRMGIRLIRHSEGAGELQVYFDPAVPVDVRIIFGKYVHEHLLRMAKEVSRLRHYACPQCDTVVGNREVAMDRLGDWLSRHAKRTARKPAAGPRRKRPKGPTIVCARCEGRVQLWDPLEQHFASIEIRRRVRELEEQSNVRLEIARKRRAFVNDVISTCALAGQMSREVGTDDGIDMELEFVDSAGRATSKRVLLHLQAESSGWIRKPDGTLALPVRNQDHLQMWMRQEVPVFLVARDTADDIRWMEVGVWARRFTDNGRKTIKEIAFRGERMDVMSVRRLRETVLQEAALPLN